MLIPIGLEAGWNTYTYVGGNPMSGMDHDGLIQRDANGNIIFNQTGNLKMMHKGDPLRRFFFGDPPAATGYIYADDGTPIRANRNTMRDKYPRYNTNCHGHSFGDDIFWIDDDQVEALLKGEGYTKIGGGISGGRSINGSPQKGDIIVYYNNGKVVHSGVYIGNGRISENAGIKYVETNITSIYSGWKSGTFNVYRKP